MTTAEGAGQAGQFADEAAESRAAALGMWVFLASEMLFFGTPLLAYAVYRTAYPAAFREASRMLIAGLGAANTAVLLLSSGAMAAGVRSREGGRARSFRLWLALAALLGLAFLGIKGFEYHTDWREHLVPMRGMPFGFPGPEAGKARLFFALYFCLTGLHALHLLIAVVLAAAVAVPLSRNRPASVQGVRTLGLYWHFVDMVWVFLFPLLYLIGP